MTERHRDASDHAPGRRRLNAVDLLHDRNSGRDVSGPVIDRQSEAWRQIDRVATGVRIDNSSGLLLGVPFAIEFEHGVKRHMTMRRRGWWSLLGHLGGMRTRMRIGCARIVRMRFI